MKTDLEFLAGLDKKLHKVQERTFTPNISGDPFPVHFDTYTDKNMNKEEIKRVLNISKGEDYVIYPINTAMGFSVGYNICEILPKGKRKTLLRFKEGQLPKEYSFKKMSKTFMSEENLKKAELIKEKIVNDYDHYDY
jgi:hypothetical protein